MLSELRITAPTLDPAQIAQHLQLKGELDSAGWRFPAAARVQPKSIGQHVDYWCTLLAKKKAGRRVLTHAGYTITLRVFVSAGTTAQFPPPSIDALNRHGIGLEIACTARE